VERGHAPEFVRWLAGRGLSTRASILDVGSGNGGHLVEMARNGFTRLLGIDPYLEGSRTLGYVRLEPRTVDEVSGDFDIVLINHTFEHLSGSRHVLDATRRLLAPGGTVVIRTPVADSSASRTYGANWVQLDAPRHLAIPTEAGMAAASGAAGLRMLRSYRDGTGFQFWGSEQYALQIPLSSPQSWTEDQAASPFTQSQIDAWEDEARDLNKCDQGDSATFVLTHSSS
jgi:SAM-dependent methyltransferase